MSFTGFADSAQLSMLAKVLDDHCRDHRIADPALREDVARRVIVLFNDGARDPSSLRAALDDLGRRTADRHPSSHAQGMSPEYRMSSGPDHVQDSCGRP